jgi:hypothetical protein
MNQYDLPGWRSTLPELMTVDIVASQTFPLYTPAAAHRRRGKFCGRCWIELHKNVSSPVSRALEDFAHDAVHPGAVRASQEPMTALAWKPSLAGSTAISSTIARTPRRRQTTLTPGQEVSGVYTGSRPGQTLRRTRHFRSRDDLEQTLHRST